MASELSQQLRMLAQISAIPGPGALPVEGSPMWKAADALDRLEADKAELVAALKKTRDELVSWCGKDSGSEPVVEEADTTLAKHGGRR